MRHACIWMLPICLLMAASAGWAAAGDLGAGGAGVLSGGYLVTFNIRLGAGLPAGEAILCRAHVAPKLGGQAAETVTGVAVVTGSQARCAVELPVRWATQGGGNDATLGGEAALSYEIDAVHGGGGEPYAVRAQQGISVSLPAPNSVQSLQIRVLF